MVLGYSFDFVFLLPSQGYQALAWDATDVRHLFVKKHSEGVKLIYDETNH